MDISELMFSNSRVLLRGYSRCLLYVAQPLGMVATFQPIRQHTAYYNSWVGLKNVHRCQYDAKRDEFHSVEGKIVTGIIEL
jgi:hypothetical protein